MTVTRWCSAATTSDRGLRNLAGDHTGSRVDPVDSALAGVGLVVAGLRGGGRDVQKFRHPDARRRRDLRIPLGAASAYGCARRSGTTVAIFEKSWSAAKRSAPARKAIETIMQSISPRGVTPARRHER